MEISIGKYKMNLVVFILILIVAMVLWGSLLCSCSRVNLMEGFAMLGGVNLGQDYSKYNVPPVSTKKWANPNLLYGKGKPPSKGAQDILNRPAQPIPLPPGELDMFATTDFKPECCPNSYSTGAGCACMTVGQLVYLKERAGNNVPYSEY